MTDPVVLGRIQTAVGLETVRGTPNVGIPYPLNRRLLSSYLPGGGIDPAWEADTGQADYSWSPALIAGRYRGVVTQADEPDYTQTLIEVLCEVCLRGAPGPSDGDRITVSLPED
jgi:CTP-dependent riboflavin kinase